MAVSTICAHNAISRQITLITYYYYFGVTT